MKKAFKVINTLTNSVVFLYAVYISVLFIGLVIGHFTGDSGKEAGNGGFFIVLDLFAIGGAVINFIPNAVGFFKFKGKYLTVTFIISLVLLFISIATWIAAYLLLKF